MAKKVTVDNLAEAIQAILDEYGDDIDKNISEITRRVGQKGAQALRNESKNKFKGDKYANGWGYTVFKGRLYTTIVIHNKKQAGLAHLLEHGHVKANGTGRYGRWDGIEHIAPVEQELVADYEKEVVDALH